MLFFVDPFFAGCCLHCLLPTTSSEMSRAFSVLEVVLTKMLEPLVSPHKRTLVHPDSPLQSFG